MSDILYKDRKIRRVKRESINAQKSSLKNRDRPDKKRGEKRVKK